MRIAPSSSASSTPTTRAGGSFAAAGKRRCLGPSDDDEKPRADKHLGKCYTETLLKLKRKSIGKRWIAAAILAALFLIWRLCLRANHDGLDALLEASERGGEAGDDDDDDEDDHPSHTVSGQVFQASYCKPPVPTKVKSAAYTGITFQAIREVEVEANRGWNGSTPTRIAVLGTQGYTKRDLPVYTKAFEKMPHIEVVPRTELGKYDATTSADSGLLCLSFNSAFCFDDEEVTRLSTSRGLKVNRILNLKEVLWSKHEFCRTLREALTRAGRHSAKLPRDFVFPCWVMPGDYQAMLKESARDGISRWIAKPRSLGAGMGIQVVDTLDELKKERSSNRVIQAYLPNPHLLTGEDGRKHKWDARTYVLVTSVRPSIRAYVYTRGLIRLATAEYSTDCKSRNGTACLTNTSINKKFDGARLKDITWSFAKLRSYLERGGDEADGLDGSRRRASELEQEDQEEEDSEDDDGDGSDSSEIESRTEQEASSRGETFPIMFERIQRAVGLVLLAAEPAFSATWPKNFQCRGCFQLLGVDVIFDDQRRAKIIEVNGEPSMRLTSSAKTHYDVTKLGMVEHLAKIVFARDSSARVAHEILKRTMNKCKLKNPAKLAKSHVSYVLDAVREREAMNAKKDGFAPVYPHPNLMGEFRSFLVGRGVPLSRINEQEEDEDEDQRLAMHDLIAETMYGR